MNSLFTLALSAALALSLTACGGNSSSASGQDAAASSSASASVQIPNPWTSFSTLEEAQEAAGFPLTLPVVSGDLTEDCSVLPGEETLLDVSFFRADDTRALSIRKAPGTADVSGDYNVYAKEENATVNGASVALRGNDDGFHLATWTMDGYTYAVSSEDGLSLDALTQLVEAVR